MHNADVCFSSNPAFARRSMIEDETVTKSVLRIFLKDFTRNSYDVKNRKYICSAATLSLVFYLYGDTMLDRYLTITTIH